MAPTRKGNFLRLALPKGRMQVEIFRLLAAAGIKLSSGSRDYRPKISLAGFEAKILKPRSIVEMLHVGSRDIGFAGSDWVAELGADLVEVLNTDLDPVRIVAAAPKDFIVNGRLPNVPLVVASEYKRLATDWISKKGLPATFVRSYGATEVFPPEDADCIVDNTSSGSTLRANGLQIVDQLMTSSTCLYVNPRVLDSKDQQEKIERLVLLLRSVLESRRRVMVEVNVSAAKLEAVIKVLPCMREPTISSLYGNGGYAVKAAVPRDDLPRVIPEIKASGGNDIVVTQLTGIVP